MDVTGGGVEYTKDLWREKNEVSLTFLVCMSMPAFVYVRVCVHEMDLFTRLIWIQTPTPTNTCTHTHI